MEKISIISDRIIRIGFGLLFILVPLILTPWNYELFEYNKMMVTYGLSSVIIGAWLIKMIVGNEIRIKRTPLDIPIILFVLSQLVSTLFSMDPHVSWFGYYSRFNGGMLSVITYVALYYAFVSNFISKPNHATENRKQKAENGNGLFRSPSSVVRLLIVIVITGLIVSLYGIAEHFGIDKNIWIQDVQNRVFSTLGQPNWLAAYLMALIPLAMAFSLYALSLSHSEDRRQRAEDRSTFFSLVFSVFRSPLSVFYFVISIVFFITLLWTRSRSGFVAFAVADVVFWGMIFKPVMPDLIRHLKDSCFRRNDKGVLKGEAFQNIVRPFLLIHAAFFLIIVINGVYVKQIDDWITIKAWQQRFTKISSPPSQSMETTSSNSAINNSSQPSAPLIESGVTESGDIRKYVWQGAVNAWRSSLKTLFIGTGTETYAFAFYLYKPIGHNLTSEWDFLYNKAHNEYLNFLATTGIVGLGTYLLLIGAFIVWFVFRNNPLQQTYVIPAKAGILKIPGQARDDGLQGRNEAIIYGLFSGWISILITNFFGFSVVITQLMFYLFPAIIFSLTYKDAPPPADGRGMMRPSYLTYPLDWQMKAKKIASAIIWIITILLVVALFVTWYSDKQFARGYHLARSGYKPQAYQALSSAITFNPTEPIFHDEQGTILSTLALAAWKENQATMSQELATLSIKENDTALSISPNNVNFWKSRTKIFYALSSVDPSFLKEAINALEKGLTLSPLDPKMYYNLAVLYGQAGLSDKSSEFMKKSIELKPNYREGYYGLFLLYKEAGMPTEAQQTINVYLTKVDPTDKEFLELIQ